MIRVLVVDDNPVIRSGLVALLRLEDTITVVGEAGTGKEAVEKVSSALPHVVLMDVRMPVMDGIEATEKILAGTSTTKVLMLTYTDEEDIVAQAIQAGASGYVVHGRFKGEELTEAITRVHEGGSHVSPTVAPALFELVRRAPAGRQDLTPDFGLTEREVDVVNLIARGMSNAEIAGELFIGEKTVKNHINRAYAKLDVTNRAQAIAVWLGTGGVR
ncbi:response regulator [Euzebya tangerina]|uniref:response regulator n=1 Tax=Euzebya tangerina TaxID=591198 RepID=UPI000E322B4F|nr:response regulator transcription factor [Euzebya tangerina]